MSQQMRMHLIGPDRYCPDCGRWLVRVHKDGTFDLAGHSSVSIGAEWDPDSLDEYERTEDGALIIETMTLDAECEDRSCLLRRS